VPIYEFRCRECGTTFEAIRRMGDRGYDLDCPRCGSKDLDKPILRFRISRKRRDGSPSAAGSCGGSGFS